MMEKSSKATWSTQSAQGTLETSVDSQAAAEDNAGDCGTLLSVQAWVSRLGMLPDVAQQWALWHTNPAVAMAWFFTAECDILTHDALSACFLSRRTPYVARALQAIEPDSQHRSLSWSTHHSLLLHYPLHGGHTSSVVAHNCCLALGPKHHTFKVFPLHSTLVVHWIWDATHCHLCRAY
jgi:hypothetical protein